MVEKFIPSVAQIREVRGLLLDYLNSAFPRTLPQDRSGGSHARPYRPGLPGATCSGTWATWRARGLNRGGGRRPPDQPSGHGPAAQDQALGPDGQGRHVHRAPGQAVGGHRGVGLKRKAKRQEAKGMKKEEGKRHKARGEKQESALSVSEPLAFCLLPSAFEVSHGA